MRETESRKEGQMEGREREAGGERELIIIYSAQNYRYTD